MTGKKGETPSNEPVLADSAGMAAEWLRQPSFRLSELFQTFVLGLAMYVGWTDFAQRRPREIIGTRTSPVRIHNANAWIDSATLRIAGAWELRSGDPRFGGFSDIALRDGQFLGLTDSAVIAVFHKPTASDSSAVLKELPEGPRWTWDSEALEKSRDAGSYWVSFEQDHQLWLYDAELNRALKHVRLQPGRWADNFGIEGIVDDGTAVMIFPEGRPEIGRLDGSVITFHPVKGLRGRFSEAAMLPDGNLWALERSFSPLGFKNALVEIEADNDGYRVTQRHRLGVGALDNIEGLTAERLPDGRTRLWLISDDNFQRPLRTLLLAIDLPPKRRRVP